MYYTFSNWAAADAILKKNSERNEILTQLLIAFLDTTILTTLVLKKKMFSDEYSEFFFSLFW